MPLADTRSPIDLELIDARVRLRLKLPAGWSWQRVPAPSRIDREGKVTPRLEARCDAGGAELWVGASYLPSPSGLTAAVVYWCPLYGLNVPESATQWGSHEAFVSYSPSDTTPQVCFIWLKVADSVIELRIQAETTTACDALFDWLRINLECESLEVAEPVASEPWWMRVKRLRELGRIDEAISVAERDGDRAEALLVQADLHIERMHRAQAAGQSEIMREAWQCASACAHAYAASATSGGEGAARSVERDQLLARLGPEPT